MSDYKRRNINIDKLSSYVRRTGICTEEAALHLMDEIMFLRADLSQGWQQSFYQAQDTIEIQKREIAVLQSLVPMLDGQCDICGTGPAIQMQLCEEHKDKLAE